MTIAHLENHPHAMVKNGRVLGIALFENCSNTELIDLIKTIEWKADEAVSLCENGPANAATHSTWDKDSKSFSLPTPEYLLSINAISEYIPDEPEGEINE